VRSPLLALFIRSLRQDMRSGATYWARAGLGAFFLLVLLLFALTNSWLGAPGRWFFLSIIALQMVSITFVGLSYFASAIAEEKEEQTLGLLRMTGLDPLSILLGKSTSRLCGALLFVTAQLPFTIFAITLGGVSLREIAAAYCTLLAFTFLLCNVALLGSVLARRTAGAVAFCLCTPVLLGLVWGLLVGAQQWLSGYSQMHWVLGRMAAVIAAAEPVARLREVLGTGFSGSPIGRQVIVDVAFGLGCFLLAWALFERLCDRAPDKTFALGRVPPAVRNKGPTAAGNVLRRVNLRWLLPPRVWEKALLWKDFYFLHGGRTAFVIRSVLYGSAVLFSAWSLPAAGTPMSQAGVSMGVSSILSLVFSIDLAVTIGRIFRVEINEQTFTTLAVLPCSIREIANRKLLACLLALAPGAVCMIAGQILFLMDVGKQGAILFVSLLSDWATDILLGFVVVWFSLHLKRGAAPLGWVVTKALGAVSMGICEVVIMLTALAVSKNGLSTQRMVSSVFLAPALFGLLALGAAWMLRRMGIGKLEEIVREN
jgi:hypothetical protein